MLVVADQRARGIGGQRGLAGARKAEEDGAVTPGAHVGRAVHGHDAPCGQQIVQHGEHRLLHFARILRAANEHEAVREIDGDHRLAGRAVAGGISPEGGQIDDGETWREARAVLRHDQQVLDEQRVPGELGDDTDGQPVGGVGPAGQVLDMEVLQPGMDHEVLAERLEGLPAHRPVVVPPDRVFGGGVAHDELVVGAAAGVRAGGDGKAAALRHQSLAPRHRVLVEHGCWGIPRQLAHPGQAKIGKFGTEEGISCCVHRVLLCLDA